MKIRCLDRDMGQMVDCTSRVVWKAAVGVSRWFNESEMGQKHLMRGKNILELGTGTGLLGIFAHLKMRRLGRDSE